MNGIYIPTTNHISSEAHTRVLIGQEGSKETYLEPRAYTYLKNCWAVHELDLNATGRKLSGHSSFVGYDYYDRSHIYRVGNICIMNLYYTVCNITNGVFIDIYQLPWKPYFDIGDEHDTPIGSGYVSTVRVKVSKDTGIVSIANYNQNGSRVQEVTSNLIFPLAMAIE